MVKVIEYNINIIYVKQLFKYQYLWIGVTIPNGWGEFYFKRSVEMYEGGWKEGKKHGKGRWYWRDGSSWEGTFRNDELHGRYVYYLCKFHHCRI